ncbi:NlpC/P60 family protein [Rickettsiales endosymbiont of Stachyamoeba lipophora]|uniref:NlpC/P60 family protein n=1 Tax=Rickettsiales endosymbiont of Stachyamoeba lipophora TaxID=2486578 RepID=UPI000F64BF80|nr:NlpC/P60 family protein [Rickettsiales endosymbiont of Stachyamoeba lipophora]AZL15538.1 hypothetical protein EF513_03095 [Rickettsiales endosymbiont of Stachyamoeba lipophora]
MHDKNTIILQARTWLGTKFQHQGRIKKSANDPGGVDCIGLIIGVAHELGINIADHTGYRRLPNQDKLLEISKNCLVEKDISTLEVSDIVLLKIDQEPQHFALIAQGVYSKTMIHSYAPLRRVVEHGLDPYWSSKIIATFKFPTNYYK